MFSLVKLALFSLIAFAAVALAIPSPADSHNDARTLIVNANADVAEKLLSLNNVDSVTGCIPVFQEVIIIVEVLTQALGRLNLDGCGCGHEILALIATLLETIFRAIYSLPGTVSDLGPALADLVAAVVGLLNVVLFLVDGLVGELLILLIGNGCAGILLKLKLSVLTVLINRLGLGGLLGLLG